jgi:hypothetical protein
MIVTKVWFWGYGGIVAAVVDWQWGGGRVLSWN